MRLGDDPYIVHVVRRRCRLGGHNRVMGRRRAFSRRTRVTQHVDRGLKYLFSWRALGALWNQHMDTQCLVMPADDSVDIVLGQGVLSKNQERAHGTILAYWGVRPLRTSLTSYDTARSSWSNVHDVGVRSGRHRAKRGLCRNRSP